MNPTIATASLFAVLLASTVGAQPVMEAGTRVRVWLPDTAPTAASRNLPWSRVGHVESMDARTIVLRIDGGTTDRLSLTNLVQLDSSAGQSTHRMSGAIVGGLLSGAAFVGMVCGFSDGSCAVNGGNVGGFLGYYAIGAIPGVFIGRAVGGRMRGDDRWIVVWRR